MMILYLVIRGLYLYCTVFPLLLVSYLIFCLALLVLGVFDKECYVEAWEFMELDELTSFKTFKATFVGEQE